jgi:hypothetical protein
MPPRASCADSKRRSNLAKGADRPSSKCRCRRQSPARCGGLTSASSQNHPEPTCACLLGSALRVELQQNVLHDGRVASGAHMRRASAANQSGTHGSTGQSATCRQRQLSQCRTRMRSRCAVRERVHVGGLVRVHVPSNSSGACRSVCRDGDRLAASVPENATPLRPDDALLHRNGRQSRAPSTPRSIVTSTREGCRLNESGKREETQTSFKSVSWESWPQSADARTFAIESLRASASPAASGKQRAAKSLLSSARPSPTLASMARTASSCWRQRDASSARHASLSTHRCCDGKRTRARTAPSTPSAVPGVATCSSLPRERP